MAELNEFKKELAEILDCEFLTDKVKAPVAKMLSKIAKEEWEQAKAQQALEEQAASITDVEEEEESSDIIFRPLEEVELTSIREIKESLSGCEREARIGAFIDSVFLEIKNLSDALAFLEGDEYVDDYTKEKLVEQINILVNKASKL